MSEGADNNQQLAGQPAGSTAVQEAKGHHAPPSARDVFMHEQEKQRQEAELKNQANWNKNQDYRNNAEHLQGRGAGPNSVFQPSGKKN